MFKAGSSLSSSGDIEDETSKFGFRLSTKEISVKISATGLVKFCQMTFIVPVRLQNDGSTL